jgi:6-phosphofructokinase 2
MPGPELEDSEWQAAIESVRESVQSGGIVVASGSLPPGVPDDFYGRLEDALSPKDVRLLVDTSGGPLRSALSSGVYLIKPNYPEFARLVGASDLVESDITEKARGLVEGGSASVIAVSLGAGGALVVSADAAIRLHSPTVSIKSRIGAGDSMMAGLALGMNRGMPLEDIARLGLAAGAAAVMTPGTELCRGEDVERLFGELQDSD